MKLTIKNFIFLVAIAQSIALYSMEITVVRFKDYKLVTKNSLPQSVDVEVKVDDYRELFSFTFAEIIATLPVDQQLLLNNVVRKITAAAAFRESRLSGDGYTLSKSLACIQHNLLSYYLQTCCDSIEETMMRHIISVDRANQGEFLEAVKKMIKNVGRLIAIRNKDKYAVANHDTPVMDLISERDPIIMDDALTIFDLASYDSVQHFERAFERDDIHRAHDGFNLLHFWVLGGNREIFSFLRATTTPMEWQMLMNKKAGKAGWSPFLFAIANGRLEEARMLLHEDPTCFFHRSHDNSHVLHVWSIKADPQALDFIFAHGGQAIPKLLLSCAGPKNTLSPESLADMRENNASALLQHKIRFFDVTTARKADLQFLMHGFQ